MALLQDFDLLKIVIRAWIGVWLEKVDAGRIVLDGTVADLTRDASLEQVFLAHTRGTQGPWGAA